MTAARLSQTGLGGRSTRTPPLPWARIESVAGAASDVVYVDSDGVAWRCVQWSASAADGLVIAVTGLADVLIAGGGACGQGSSGTGGWLISGFRSLAAGLHPVVVGAGGDTGGGWGRYGRHSSLGSLRAAGGAPVTGMGAAGSWNGTPTPLSTGVLSSITGTAIEYCRGDIGSAPSLPGQGGADGVPGFRGAVIVRVPV